MKTLSVRQPKIARLLAEINKSLALKKLSARQLALVSGIIISNMLVLGNICKLMTKALHRKIDTRLSWGSVLSLDMDSIEELILVEQILRSKYSLNAVPKLNSRSLLFNSQLSTRLVP